jgi:hypothetical protein
MATTTQLGTAAVFTVGTVDLKDQLTSITMDPNVPALVATTLADSSVQNVAGLPDAQTTFTVLGNFATTDVVQTLFGDVGTKSDIVYEPLAAAPGASSPRYTHTGGYLASLPITVNVGELVEVTVTYSGGSIAQNVTPPGP